MKTAKVLCVDDTYSNLEILSELLDQYEVVVALNAKGALKILEDQHIDMILLDIMMPEIDGFTLCEMIKQKEIYKNIPILFLSAKTDEESIEKGYELGGVDYVSKPFKPRELLSRVKTHLKLSSLVNNLEQQVEDGIKQQRHNEHLLVKQSYAASMGQMIDVVAHQWKQPLNVLNMRLSTLKIDYEDEMIDEHYIKELQEKSLYQIRHLVNTLDDFRSFMSPHQKIEKFSVQEMLQTCLTLIKDELTLHKIKIDIDTQNDFTIEAIENEFIHIVLNIVNNAKDILLLHKVENRQIDIVVDSLNRAISIKDNGVGIAKEDLESVFDLYFTRKKGGSGSGLGLYMSKMIVEKYGGIISVNNSLNSGAIFSIIMPPRI
jgi:two-component system, sensor histidine kinase and response regulator